VASGGLKRVADAWVNEDVLAHAAAASTDAPLALRSPYAFEPAIAPHIAAQQAGVTISFGRIVAAARQLEVRCDLLVVEGAGGLRVPLGEAGDMADLMQCLGYPVWLVVGMRLGCLNHACLTLEALASRGLTLGGWIANEVQPQMPAFEGNLTTLAQLFPMPPAAVWRWGEARRLAS
jgi:dethiobiotin synthetase